MNLRNRLTLILLFAAIATGLVTGYSPAREFNIKAPDISTEHWINSEPLNWNVLKNKVVLVEFWTFECYNCKNVEPYVKKWYNKYKNKGLQVVAVHSPEFDRERKIDNVRDYINEHGISYPVAIDNEFKIWKNFSNRYWPAMYLVDKTGTIRYRFIGEGNYRLIEKNLQQLLDEHI